MKRIKRLLCLVLCVLMLPLFTQGVAATNFSGITSDSIKDKQNQISQAEDLKKELQGTLSDIKKMKEELESKKSNLKSYVAELDKQLGIIEKNISDLKLKISAKEEEIIQTEKELELAQATELNQYESMKTRIKFIYQQGDSYFFDILLTAGSFGDFLNKADYVEKLYAYDRKMWEEFQLNRELIELCKQQLELDKEILDETKKGVEQEQNSLESLISQKNKDIISYESDINNKEQTIKEYEEEIKAQNELMAALEAAVAEEKRKILASSGKVLTYDGGVFKFPMATYTRISDNYGNRIHPTLGVPQFHNGVDFAAPKGTAIYAAYDGMVVASAYSTTMGNYVMIDHGDDLYTIYMHASALYVEKGAAVVRGETIAAVGTTGRSTGNHLHFSVRLKGSYVTPWNYLSQ